jgi:4-hydroxyproline epimerase
MLEEGAIWRQAGMAGGVFEATYRRQGDDAIIPTITGRAFITAHGRLLLQSDDPFCFGIRP